MINPCIDHNGQVVNKRERVPEIVDQSLEAGTYDTASMEKMVKIALACTIELREGRQSPTMTQLYDEISQIRH
jgi:hypothetical protein